MGARISVQGLTMIYGSLTAVDNVSFTVDVLPIAVLLGFTVVLAAIAARLFRWEA